MDEERINQALKFLEEGKFKEYENLLIENINKFPKEVQVKIISALIEVYLVEEAEKLRTYNSILEELIKILK